MSCKMTLRNTKEMARIVAAAGLTSRQENMNARLMMVQALMARKKWAATYLSQPDAPSNTPNMPSHGIKTNNPPGGNKRRANRSPNKPSANTSTNEKTTPASHFSNKSLAREIGRDSIILKVPSSASFATKSPPTSET